jgi:hypothetical protein
VCGFGEERVRKGIGMIACSTEGAARLKRAGRSLLVRCSLFLSPWLGTLAFSSIGSAQTPGGITDQGAITQWLVLGPFGQPYGCGPSIDQMRLDYLTDGTIPADIWTPNEGDEIRSDCGGAAACLQWQCNLAAIGDKSIDCGVSPPAKVAFLDSPDLDGYIDLNSYYGGGFGGDPPSNSVAYAWSYIINNTQDPITATVGHNSDDSHRVLVNFAEVTGSPAVTCRAPARTTFDQDTLGPVVLNPGYNVVMAETWEGGGNWGFRIRFLDETNTPLTAPTIEVADPLQFPDELRQLVFIRRTISSQIVNGTSGPVTLLISPRFGPGTMVVTEKMPAGLSASNPKNGGVLAGDTITWNLGTVSQDVTVSYTLTAAADAVDAVFDGSTATADGKPIIIGGDRSYTGAPFNNQGFIKLWDHLGPLAWVSPAKAGDSGPVGACDTTDANGVAQLPLDWIVNADGSVTEANLLPFPGLLTRPKYGGDGVVPGGTGARAAGLTVEPGDTGRVVKDRFPAWHGSLARTDTIDETREGVDGFDADEHVDLHFVYVTNHTGNAIDTTVGYGSDDSIQILVNGVDITQGGTLMCRGWGNANEEQNTASATLEAGENRILVKVADGGGPSGFRLRFQDPADATGPGLQMPALTVSLESDQNPRPGDVVRSLSKDTYGLGEKVGVSLAASAKPASAMVIQEVLPDNTAASSISDGGVLNGNTIVWNLAAVTQKTVTYQIAGLPCAGDLSFLRSSFTVGQDEVVMSGKSTLTRLYGDDDLGAWDSRDLGTPGGGAERLGDHSVHAIGAGEGIKLLKDGFHFISTPQSGDFELSARIDCLDDPGTKGVAGLMVRESLEDGGANVFFGMSALPPVGGGVGTLKGSSRAGTGKSTAVLLPTTAPKDVQSLPLYLKIKRAGAGLSFQRSTDGVTYTELVAKVTGTAATQINLPDQVRIGLAVTGGSGGITRAGFSQVSGPPFTSAGLNPPQSLAAVGGSKQVALNWSAPAAGAAPASYLVKRGAAGGPYTQVAEVTAPATTYTDIGLADGTQFCYVVASKKGATVSADSGESCARTTAGGGVTFRRGDVDANGVVEITDAVKLLGYLFLGGGTPECLEAGDTDDNGVIDITDAVTNLGYQFLGQAPPAAPGPLTCGPDPAEPMLGCDRGCQ